MLQKQLKELDQIFKRPWRRSIPLPEPNEWQVEGQTSALITESLGQKEGQSLPLSGSRAFFY